MVDAPMQLKKVEFVIRDNLLLVRRLLPEVASVLHASHERVENDEQGFYRMTSTDLPQCATTTQMLHFALYRGTP